MSIQISFRPVLMIAVISATFLSPRPSYAAVTAAEANQLGTSLTPLGGEKAGNKEGTIPAWTGGYTTPIKGFTNTDRRTDPFAGEKPLYSITAANMEAYSAKLTDGTKAMLKRYPTYRVDVYPTHRTAAAPQWVYDNTKKNAVSARMEGEIPKGAFGGIPFPIPQSGREIMANHTLHWRGQAWNVFTRAYLITAEGRRVMTVEADGKYEMPYYNKERGPEKFDNGEYWWVRLINAGPAVRAGEAVLGRLQMDEEKSQAWVYLTGQRRVRKLPNACCDTPAAATAGIMTFDELDVISGRVDRFDFKILGKQEILIPYNSNRMLTPTKDSDLVLAHHLNPDHIRWELHRVWVVETNLKPGARHVAPKGKYYFDEDTWIAVLGDRWDANGALWKMMWQHPLVMPDIPATTAAIESGFYDFLSGAWFARGVYNELPNAQYKIVPPYRETVFSPDALAAETVR